MASLAVVVPELVAPQRLRPGHPLLLAVMVDTVDMLPAAAEVAVRVDTLVLAVQAQEELPDQPLS